MKIFILAHILMLYTNSVLAMEQDSKVDTNEQDLINEAERPLFPLLLNEPQLFFQRFGTIAQGGIVPPEISHRLSNFLLLLTKKDLIEPLSSAFFNKPENSKVSYSFDKCLEPKRMSNSGKKAIMRDERGIMHIFDVYSGRLLHRLNHAIAAQFSPQENIVATWSDARNAENVTLWDVATGKEIACFIQREPFWVDIDTTESKVLIVSQSSAKIWDIASKKCVDTLERDRTGLMYGTFSPSGNKVLIASHDGKARIYAFGHFQCELQGNSLPDRAFYGAKFNKAEDKILTTTSPGGLWDIATKTRVIDLYFIHQALFTPDGSKILTVFQGNGSTIFEFSNAQTGNRLECFKIKKGDWFFLNDTGEYFLNRYGNYIELWHIPSKRKLCSFSVKNISAGITNTGDVIVFTDNDTVRIWNIDQIQRWIEKVESGLELDQVALLEYVFHLNNSSEHAVTLNQLPDHFKQAYENLPITIKEAFTAWIELNTKNAVEKS